MSLWLGVLFAYALYAFGLATPDPLWESLGFGLLLSIMALSLIKIADRLGDR